MSVYSPSGCQLVLTSTPGRGDTRTLVAGAGWPVVRGRPGLRAGVLGGDGSGTPGRPRGLPSRTGPKLATCPRQLQSTLADTKPSASSSARPARPGLASQ